MASEEAEPTLGRLSPASVREATGRGWDDWAAELDGAGAANWEHKKIVAYLEKEHPEVGSWWRQSLTVGYEQARGRRVVGQTAAAGFQVGVQRSVPATAAEVWELIVSRPDLWLGEGASTVFEQGASYEVPGTSSGTVRVVKPGDRLRMTWQPQGWEAPATLQLTLSESPWAKTAVHVHLEKLPGPEAREAMRARWREALERIATEVSARAASRTGPAT